jgi:hypothetical protein
MHTDIPTPEHSPQDVQSPAAPPQHANKPQRTLACLLCQQRKVRCDRQFPCANCTKAGVHCVSAALAPRQRRRRFAERELLDRIRHYENLLTRNKITYEPLHPLAAERSASHVEEGVEVSQGIEEGQSNTTALHGEQLDEHNRSDYEAVPQAKSVCATEVTHRYAEPAVGTFGML